MPVFSAKFKLKITRDPAFIMIDKARERYERQLTRHTFPASKSAAGGPGKISSLGSPANANAMMCYAVTLSAATDPGPGTDSPTRDTEVHPRLATSTTVVRSLAVTVLVSSS
jgi:hypothetical protein